MFQNEVVSKIIKIFIYWLISYCLSIIIQRFLFVIVAMYMGYSFEVGPMNPMVHSGAYQYSLPLIALFQVIVFYYSSYFFFYEGDYESPNEMRRDAVLLTVLFFGLNIAGDLLLWVLLPWPMAVPLKEFYAGMGIWNLPKYILAAVGTFLGARPYYLKKLKYWEQ